MSAGLTDDRQETSGFLETSSEPGILDGKAPELVAQINSERSATSVSGALTAQEQLNNLQEQELENSIEREEDLSSLNNVARAEDLASSVDDQTTDPEGNSEIQTPLSKIDPATMAAPSQTPERLIQDNARSTAPGTVSQAAETLSRPNNQEDLSVLTGAKQSTPGFSVKMARAENH